jgi:hypothetical protein
LHASYDINATKLKILPYRRIITESQIGPDNDTPSLSVRFANKAIHYLIKCIVSARWEMNDSILVLLLSEAHAMAFHEEV